MFVLAISAASAVSCSETNQTETENVEQANLTIPKKGDVSLPTSNADFKKLIKAGQGQKYKYSVEDFFKNPEQTRYRISPNGDYYSYMSPYENRMNVYIQKIGDTEAKRITDETERDISGYFWANNNRILYIKDKGGNENFSLYGVDIDGGNFTDLSPYDSVRIQMIDPLEDIDDEIIIGMNKDNQSLFEPYNLNINSGEIKKLAENKNMQNPISGWLTDHEGNIRIAMQVVDGINARILYRDDAMSEFSEIITTNFKETFNPLFFEFDNSPVVYASSNIGRDKEAIVRFDLKTKQEEVLFEHNLVDVNELRHSRHGGKKLTYANYTSDKVYRHYFDENTKLMFEDLESKLPGYEIALVNSNKEENKYLVRTYSDKSRGAYYFYDKSSKNLKKLVEVSPNINETDMADQKPISYQSRDGLTIHGYLTLPKGVEAKNLPIVINPHGGPWARDNWGFNPEIQLMANRGYGVLQMNFRGSTGYGKEFWQASFKEWGKKMQNDITDGVNWLIDQGIADADRIAIYGGSYGGYATLAGVTYTPELYACAVDYVGVSNLHTFMKTIPPYWKPYLEMMYEMVGNPETENQLMIDASPVNFVDNIQCPLFVAQGANDPRVNIDESDQIVQALRDKGINVPYMVKYDEGHGFHNEENRFEFYNTMMGFFVENLKKKKVEQKFK